MTPSVPPRGASALRISLPTPYPVGRVNAWLIPGDPPALVDCGVKSTRSLDELAAALAAQGVALESLGVVLLTHPHYDHAGAAVELSRRYGVPVRYHPAAARPHQVTRPAFREALARYGGPPDLQAELDVLDEMGDRFGEALEEAPTGEPLADGERLRAGALTLEVLHTPGHNAAHLCYHAPEAGLLFCGDLLLPTITPNPLPHFDPEAPRGRHSSLTLYLASLDRVEALGALTGLGGHGGVMPDTLAVAHHARQAIARRRQAVRALCQELPGVSLFALAERLFGEEGGIGRALAFTEILAHCDWLEAHGELEVDHDAGVVVGLRD